MKFRPIIVLGMYLIALAGLVAPPARAANDAPTILISEIQVADKASASNEFVELYNASDAPVALDGLMLEYRSSTSSAGSDCAAGWTKKATLPQNTIAPHSFYLLAPTGYLKPDAVLTSGFASAGTIRLRNTAAELIDAVAWGKSACGLGDPSAAPPAGGSIERRPGADKPTAGNAYDTNDNATDFLVRAVSEPQSAAAAPETPDTTYVPILSAPGLGGVAANEVVAFEMNEFLPDPAAPASDATGEYIEFFNPSAEPATLKGYVVKTGSALGTKHTLPDVIVPGGGYAAVYSAVSKIALSNSGSSAALFAPDGTQVGPTVTWGKAKTGEAWARFDDTWAWTAEPTPVAANELVVPTSATAAAAAKAKASTSASVKKASAKTTTTSKTKTATEKAKAKAGQAQAALASAGSSPGGRWLLFTLAGLTIAYIIYEFRFDLQNFLRRFGRHRQPRPAVVPVPLGGRDHRAGE